MDLSIVAIVIQLIFLEGILSIDNAAVLGAMVSVLPVHEPIPWPKALRKIGHPIDRLLGGQQAAALKVGLLGAYLGRGLMLLVASYVVQNPWLKLLGAAYLVHLALENLGRREKGETDAHVGTTTGKSFWGVVLTVELADLAFSLDNVVAAVALSDKLWVVMLGVALGIVTMRFAAGLFTIAVKKEPILKVAAYVLVFNIGLELIWAELTHHEIHDMVRFAISIGTIVLSIVYAHSPLLQKILGPVFIWIGEGFGNLNELINWLLKPLIGLIKLPFRLLHRKPSVKEEMAAAPLPPHTGLD